MTSATLFREGDDLDELLAELDARHPGQVRVVSVSYPRQGGVFGFFARQRVAVEYALDTDTFDRRAAQPVEPSARAFARELDALTSAAADAHPLAALLDAADAADTAVAARPADTLGTFGTLGSARTLGARSTATAAGTADIAGGTGTTRTRPVESVPPAQRTAAENAEFAKLLLELAARKSAESAAETGTPDSAPVTPAAIATPVPARVPTPVPIDSSAAASPAPAVPEASRAQLTLRRRLAEIGVPIDWVPEDSADTYRVVEQLVRRLPVAPEAPRGAGDLLVIVGPPATALRTAQTMRTRLHLRPDAVWTAGCGDRPGAASDNASGNASGNDSGNDSGSERVITDAWQAATVAAELRLSGHGPAIIVIGLDPDPEEPGAERWAGDLVRALAPEALWVVVDATRKPSDTRALLRDIGTPTALVVTAAERTASPASVWELGAPTVLLDGRPATRGTWAALLIDKLAALES